jgi:signal peptidase I
MRKKAAIALAEPPEPEPRRAERRHWMAEWSINVLVLLFAFASVAQPFVVPTGSMEGNILVGDHILVDKLAYSPHGGIGGAVLPYTDVRRGDVIVFRWPVDIRETYVKRVIGVPGDRIRIAAKQLYLNGRAVEEPYKTHRSPMLDSYRDSFPSPPNTAISAGAIEMLERHVLGGEIVVPPGRYFALGDNRDNSSDSRYWGFVPRENIIGKPLIIYWSYDAPTDALADPSISIDHIIDLVTHFPTKTRWKRTFNLIHGYPLK